MVTDGRRRANGRIGTGRFETGEANWPSVPKQKCVIIPNIIAGVKMKYGDTGQHQTQQPLKQNKTKCSSLDKQEPTVAWFSHLSNVEGGQVQNWQPPMAL